MDASDPHGPSAPKADALPQDRFDDLPAEPRRVGAHRAENPRLRFGGVLLWSAIATVVIILVGVFGTMLATGRLSFAPAPAASQSAGPVAPEVDTSYPVLVLNATAQEGLGGEIRDLIVDAGWSGGDVQDDNANTDDFPTTTVYYQSAADEAAARGLADVIGGAEVSLDDTYQVVNDPGTPSADGTVGLQLVVIVGLDHRTE
ncbi:LytR C-terminal domain-containing protein [Microbacterium sp. 179-B 1A2 NHS]|uniref:LytR C-terminal domain-containing protein n=1 Tax=Microbacterium sp. 179-B 1A2 NHS TaxID=3142383 RepID=UPI0039A3119A